MTRFSLPMARKFRLVAFAAALCCAAGAQADEYDDVNQLLRSGKTAEALAKADQHLAAKPRDPQMRFLKGVIQTEAGRAQDAVATFTKLTEDYPELPEPYNNLAVLHASQGQFDKARAALEMAIRTNPSYSTAHENLGDVYAKLASQAYSKALQLDASNTAVQPKLALIRELFNPNPRGARAAAAPAAAAATTTTASVRTPAAAAPAPAAPPAVAAAPAPAARPAASTPVAAAPAPAARPAASAPVAAAPAAAPAAAAAASAPAAANASREVESAIQAWAAAWAAKDMANYLAAYGKDFDPPGQMSRKAWEEERRSRIVGKSRISVKLSDLAVSVSGNRATARFKQAYQADALNVSSRKTLEMVKAGDRWVIVRESTGA